MISQGNLKPYIVYINNNDLVVDKNNNLFSIDYNNLAYEYVGEVDYAINH